MMKELLHNIMVGDWVATEHSLFWIWLMLSWVRYLNTQKEESYEKTCLL